jgi:hypothetical protein
MKIIISENQELKAKKKIAFFLLEKQNYNLVEIGDNIYFVKKIGDEYTEIRFDKSDGYCYVSYGLYSFLTSMTGFQESEVQELISNWVEHVLQMKVKYNIRAFVAKLPALNIPYNQHIYMYENHHI